MTTFQKYFLISLIIAFLNAALLIVFFVPRLEHSDTPEYVATINYVAGNPEGEVVNSRILKPLPILIGGLLAPVLETKNTLVFQNLFFYFLSVCLIFIIIRHLYQNEKQAFYGTILYIGAYPMLAFGLAPLTDTPGWFFYLLVVFIILYFFEKDPFRATLLSGLITGFGMLFKENVVAVGFFFTVFLFIATHFSLKEKLKYIFIFSLAFLLFPLINSIIIYNLYSYSYLDWLGIGGIGGSVANASFYMIGPFRIVLEIGRVMMIGWIFVLLGIFKERIIKNSKRIKILIALTVSFLYTFLWCYPHNRMFFVAVPFLILLGSLGILRNYKNSRINTSIELGLLSIYFLVNYFVFEFLIRYGAFLQQFLIYNI